MTCLRSSWVLGKPSRLNDVALVSTRLAEHPLTLTSHLDVLLSLDAG